MKINRCILFLFLLTYNGLFSQEIKIMSWNTFMMPPFIYKSCQAERALLQSEFIIKQNPDIVILNETFIKSARNIFLNNLKQLYPYQSKITKNGFFKSNSGVWVFSKYPLTNQQFMKFKNRKGNDIFAKKGAVFVEATLPHSSIQLIATHTQSDYKHRYTREKQFAQIKLKLADKYLKDSVPQFIIGDLNCNYYDSLSYHNMLHLLDVLPVNFLGNKYSWDGKENDLAYTFYKTANIRETLDYILLRIENAANANILSATILNTKQDSCFCNRKFFNLSDHYPILSTILLK